MTTAKAVRTLRAPVISFSPHARGQPTGIVVAIVPGAHPINVGGRHSVGVASEGDVIPLIVSHEGICSRLAQRAGISLKDVAISSDVRGPSRYERTPDTAHSHSY